MRPSNLDQNPISSLKSSQRTNRAISVILSLLIINLFSGCRYYRVKGVAEESVKSQMSWLQEFNQADKFIVLHQNGISQHLQNAQIDESSYELKGIPTELPAEHTYKHPTEIGKGYRYKKESQSPLNEVHLFIDNQVTLNPGQPVRIPIASIEKIGYSEKDAVRGAANVVGLAVGTLALIAVIVALTKSSCPFIYVDDGGEWVFQGEIYPGNVYENAQKTNYLKLPDIVESDGFYTLQITNELLEIQHTDEAVLEIVDHPDSVSVAMDPSGNLYTIASPEAPLKAIADDHHNIISQVAESDGQWATFDTHMEHSENKRKIDLWFNNNNEHASGKLLLSVKKSLWLDYAMGKFYEEFGDYFPKFQEDRQSISLEEAHQWREDQSLPLSVYVNTGNGWVLQHKVYAVGPLKFQELVLPIDLSGLGDDPLKIRLETGFMFWELDKVAIDYSDNLHVQKTQVFPYSAIDNYHRNVRKHLQKPDRIYLTQTEVGDWVEIKYQSPPKQSEKRTIFLRNKGYYTYIRDFEGDPDFAALRKFRNPGHFTAFAEAQYNALIQAIMTTSPEIVVSDERN